LRERAAHQASRETALPPPPEYFEQSESTLGSTDVREPLRHGEGRVLCSRCNASRPIPSDSCPTCGLQVPISREKPKPHASRIDSFRLITVDLVGPAARRRPPQALGG
jgi:hypothetical protein